MSEPYIPEKPFRLSDEVFSTEALEALQGHPDGMTLMELLRAMHHGRGFTPREARHNLERLTKDDQVHDDGAVLGRRWFHGARPVAIAF